MGVRSTPELVELGWTFTECMVLVTKMLADFHLEIAASGLSDEEQTYHLNCEPLLINAVAPVRMTAPWDQAKTAISETILSKLESADVALRRSVNEQVLVEADLRELKASIQSALDRVKDSALPAEIKAFIYMHLIRIQTALDEYTYRGAAGLQDALSGYLGSLALSSEAIDERSDQETKTSLKDVLIMGKDALTLAHGAAWAWPHLVVGATWIAGLLA